MPHSQKMPTIQTLPSSLNRTQQHPSKQQGLHLQPQANAVAMVVRPLALAVHLALSASLLATVGWVPVAKAQQDSMSAEQSQKEATRYFDIPAGPLSKVLTQFSTEAGIFLAGSTDLAQGKRSPGVQGELDIQAALNQLLAGTGLQAQANSQGQYVLGELGEVTTLPLVRVSANGMPDGAVEDGYLVSNVTGVGPWGERNLKDTPYQVSVVTGDLIEHSLAKDMNQIFKMTPTTQETGQFFTGLGDAQWVTIRGFAVKNPIINGVSYPNPQASAPMMQDIDRVEIINGATGFLYGGGRVGGAVNYITKKPSVENLKEVSIGSYGNQSYYSHIDLGGQFDEESIFGYRFNALYQDGNLPSNIEKEEKSFSLVLDWKPTDYLYSDIKYSYKEYLEKGGNLYLFNVVDRKILDTVDDISSPHWIQEELKTNKLEGNVEWDISDVFSLRTNFMYEKMKPQGGQINAFLNENAAFMWQGAAQDIESYGANFYLDSEFEAFHADHNLTIGYSVNKSKRYRSSDHTIYEPLSYDFDISDSQNLSEPDWGSLPDIGTEERTLFSEDQYENILIGDDITFNKKWHALIGLNYATVKSWSAWSGDSYDKSELTPTLSVTYKPFDKLTTYTTYMESLEAGSVVGDTYSNAGEMLEPLVSKQYEVGAKYSLSENLLLSSALFRIEKVNQYSDNASPIPKYVQDGEQIHQGVELTVTGKITDNLTIVAGGTLMDLNVDKSNNPDLEGKKPTDAASKMAKVYAEYHIPQVNGLTLTGGAYYTGEKYGDSLNTDKIPAYTLYDAGLRYQAKANKNPTTFILTVSNITDEKYWASSAIVGDGRSVSLSMKMGF